MEKSSTQFLFFTRFNRSISKNLHRRVSLLIIVLLCAMTKVQAQYSGTISVPNATFPNLGVLMDSLNAYGLGATSLTVNVTAAQTAPTGGYILGSTTLNNSLTGSKTLTFNGGGNVITAPVGTLSTTTTLAGTGAIDAIWNMSGTDNVTINNFIFTDPASNNTSTTTAMEAAIAMYNVGTAAGSANGCQNVNVTNNTFNMLNMSTYSYCVWVCPYLRGGTTLSAWSTLSDRHRGINISNNTMNEGYNFAMVRGTSLDVKARNITMSNNTVNNLGGGSVVCYGLGIYQADTIDMSNNVVNQDTLQTTTQYMLFPYYSAGRYIVRNNTINFRRAGTTGITTYGIYAYGYNYSAEAITADFTVSKNNFNWITNPTVTTTTANSFYGVYHYNYCYNWSTGVYPPSRSFVDSNNFVNDTMQGSGTLGLLYTFAGSAVTACKQFMRYNVINNFYRTGFGGTNYLYYTYGWGDTSEIAYNTFNNFQYLYPTASATAPVIYTGYNYYTVTNVKPLIHDNVWSNIGVQGLFSGSVGTFYHYMYGNDIRLYNNKWHNIFINPSSTGGGSIYGVYLLSTTNNLNIFNNVLDSFRITNSGTSTTGILYGIFHGSGGNANIYNNYIGDFIASNSTSNLAINGIYSTSTASLNIYNNTIHFGRTVALTSTNAAGSFGGSGIYFPNSTTALFNLKNNIINIKATPGAASSSWVAVRRASGTSGTKPANFTANNNTYFVSTNTNNYLYGEGTTNALVNAYAKWAVSSGTNDALFDGPCSQYKGFMQGEGFTVSEDNLATASSVANTYVPTGATLSESSAESISFVTTDLAGASRGSSPDRGALQFTGTASDVFGPIITYTDLTSVFCTNGPSFNATITDNTGVNTTSGTRPRVYYKKSTENNAFSATNTSAFNGWKWVEASNTSSPFTFTLNYSLLTSAVSTGDIIQYFVIAQDNVATPNLGTNTVTFTPAGNCPSSVNISATASITGATGTKSYTVTAPPTFSVTYTPATSCQGDTISHLISIPSTTTTFPTYTTSLASNGIPTQTLYWDLDSLSINGYVNNTGCTSGGSATAINTLPASITGRYSNYTSLGSVTSLVAGNVVNWKMSESWNAITGSTNEHYALYIDYNRNGTFELPAEAAVLPGATTLVANSNGACNSPTTWTGTFTVPLNVQSGPTLARFMVATQLITAPTLNYTYGETEDYMIDLVAVPNPVTTTFSWTSNKSGASVLGTTNPFRYPSLDTTTIFTSTINMNGCIFNVSDTVTVNPSPKRLQVFNSSQCGAGIPSCKVRDSNAYTAPIINWFATATSTIPLQSGLDTTFLTLVGSTTTMFVSVQNPSTGCWSARVPITVTVNPSDSIVGRANGIRDSLRICQGQVLNLTATNVQLPSATKSFDTFTWTSTDPSSGIPTFFKNTTGTQTITPTAGGNFLLFVDAIDTGSMCRARDTIKLSVQSNPYSGGNAFITTNPNPACIGTPVTHTLYLANPSGAFPNYTSIGTNGRPTQTLYWDIDTLLINGFINVSACAGGGSTTAINTLPASLTNQYSNYTNLGTVATLTAGNTATWGIATSGNGITGTYAIGTAIFIDYNRNGTFETNERVAFNPATFALPTTATCASALGVIGGTFPVPLDVSSGPTLLRAITNYNAVPTSATANYSYGETEDYIVNLIGAADTNSTKLSWKSNQTGATVLGTDKILVHPNPAPTTIYTVRMVNGVCIDSLKDTVKNNVPALAVNPISGPGSVCQGESILLSVASTGGCIPHSYSWGVASGGSFSAVAGGTLNNDSVLFTPSGASGNRTVAVTVTDNAGTTVSTNTVLSYNNPVPSSVISDTICGLQTATLCATPSISTDIIKWYSSSTSFKELTVGNCYTTPQLNAQTIYWLRQYTSQVDSCEPRLTSFPTLVGLTSSTTYGNKFQVKKRVVLNSVDIWPYNTGASTTTPITGTLDIGFYDANGVEIASTGSQSVTMTGSSSGAAGTATAIKLPIGIQFNPGTYTMFLKSWTNITGLDYGYQAAPPTAIQPSSTASGNFVVTQGMIGTTGYDYYNFYFWNYNVEEGCWGAAVPDTVKYITPPTLTLSRRVDSICSGSSTTPVTISSPLANYNTYTWNPSTNIAGTSASGYVFSEPTPATYKYVLSAAQTSGLLCATTDTFTLKVKTIPTAIAKDPAVASVDICNGTIQQIAAISGNAAFGKIGTGTTASTANGTVPFNSFWHDQRTQHLILASELSAMGFAAGSIDSVQYIVTSNSSSTATLPTFNVSIKMANTTATSLSGYLAPASWTSCYTNSAYPNPTFATYPQTIGFPFSTSFTWDGSSNVVLEICQDNGAWSGNIGFESTTTSFNSIYGTYQDGNTGLCATNSNVATPVNVRANPIFYQKSKYPITWSPATSLFTNSGATASYALNTPRDTVWATPVDTIKYIMTATHPNGCTVRDSIILNVKDTVTITQQPSALSSYCLGDTIKLIAKSTSTSPITKQWRKNGLNISGATNPSALTDTLKIPTTSLADSGIYDMVLSTGAPCGSKITIQAVVKVRSAVIITTQPTATSVCVGTPFSVTSNGSNDSSRFWTQIGGTNTGTSNTFSKTISAYTDSGKYFMTYKAFAPCKDKYSDTVTVRILPPALITAQPAALTTLCIGQSVTLKPSYTGALGFQWLKNGTPIAGPVGTSDSLVVTATSQADSGTYRLIVTAPSGCTNDTSSISAGIVKVNLPVSITTQPPSKTFVCQNSTFTATVSASNVSGYQWKKNGVNVSTGTGGTTNTYSISSTQPSDAGIYTVECLALTSCSNVTSINDTLVVTTLAAITTPPTAFTVCENHPISITGSATNAASYQWLLNGSPIAVGGTNNPYTKALATMADSGLYRLVALSSNAGATVCKADTSAAVLGKVMRQIVITTQPASKTSVCQNSAFNANITVQNATAYQWRKNGVNVSTGTGGTTNAYSINPTALTDAGIYSVDITGNAPCPNVTSNNDTLVIIQLPAITTQPTGSTVCQNQPFSLTNSATNASGYQWLFNGSTIAGATNATYSKTAALLSDSGWYRVVALGNMAGAVQCKADTSIQVLVSVRSAVKINADPQNSVGCIGKPFTLNVNADNVTGYQWKKNGVNLSNGGTVSGANTTSLTINPFAITDVGTYTVEITGYTPCANVTSAGAVVTSTTAAVITQEPQANSSFCLGGTIRLSVVSSSTFGYQWFKDGSPIAGATSAVFTKSGVTLADAGTYYVRAIAYNGCTDDTSANAIVTISTPISFTTQPNPSQTLCVGNNVNLNTVVAGTGPYSYQWKQNGTNIGTNASSYSKSGLVVPDSGNYTVVVRGDTACPAVSSNIARVNVNRSPVITIQPNGVSPVCIGSNIVLNTSATDVSSIEWSKQGSGVVGTGTTYTKIASTADAGCYSIVAKALTGCVDVASNNICVVVNTPASIAAQPQGAALLEDPAGSHTMSVIASGTGPFTYQWYRNGSAITGATNSTYRITNYVPALDSGRYYCEVRGPAPCSNLVSSNTVNILTVKCPLIVTNPTAYIPICAGSGFSLDVSATGVKTYQWFKDNVAIAGATFPNYSIPSATPAHSGLYRCRLFAFNDAICDITYSDTARVVVKDKPTITQQPAGISSCGGSTHTMSVKADFGERYQWFRNGIAISPDGDKSSYTYNNVNTIGDVFYVEVGNNLCPSVQSNTVTLKTVIPANQVKLASSSVFNLAERCTDANGWTYYAPSALSDTLLFAIKKYTNNITAKPDIEVMNRVRDIIPVNVENRGAILGGRLFNLDIVGTVSAPYDVKFYYAPSEEDAVMTRFRDIKRAAGDLFSSNRGDSISFIISTQRPFNSSLWNNVTIPLNFDNTIAQTDKEFGTDNGVKYVIIKRLVSGQSGGTLFMDYFLKSSSGISNGTGSFRVSLYPVPTTDGKVTVEVSNKRMKPISFRVTDVTGRTVAVFEEKHTSVDSKHEFDFGQLSNGNYQMIISNDEESAVGRFTISK